MTKLFSQPVRSIRSLRYLLAAILLSVSGTAYAQVSSDYAVVDDVTIYYAILPAEMLRTFPTGSQEARMHGGVPGGKHVHHVQVALFDATTGDRITDANVTATIKEEGLGGADYSLDPFLVGDALTYGGYVEFQKSSLYNISLRAVLPEDGRVIAETFEYRHR